MANTSNPLGAPLEDQKDPQTMGERFRQARALSPLSRTAFCQKHGLNCYTVQSWELSRSFSRIPNVTKFCDALAAEGIICTEDWLVEGVGPAPYLASARDTGVYVPPITPRQLGKKTASSHESFVQKEAALFCEHSEAMGREGVVIQVSDKAMAPEYEVGETIGAFRVPSDQIHRFYKTICLVEAMPHHFVVRQLLRDAEDYILLATNKDYPLIRLNHVTSIAEIVWRRRLSPLFERDDALLPQS